MLHFCLIKEDSLRQMIFFFDKTLFAKKVLITKYFFVFAILLELLGGWYFRTHVALTKMKEKYQILLIAHIKHV